VAGFIGSPAMNFIKAHVDGDQPPTLITLSGAKIPLPPTAPRAALARRLSWAFGRST
jgi:ABC-type sugar transport system ATPase subunit